MKTVAEMIEELKKFPLKAQCYAYEGEATGLGIRHKGKYGFIFCSETDKKEHETETLEEKRKC